MCLFVSKTRNKNRKFVYKRFDLSYGELVSPFMNTPYKLGKEKRAKGVYKNTKYERYDIAHTGIHAFSNFSAAKKQTFYGEVIVRCSVKPEDWLADGEDQECLYKKITPIKIVLKKNWFC